MVVSEGVISELLVYNCNCENGLLVNEKSIFQNHKEKTREGYLKLFSKGTPNGNQVDSSPPLPLTQPSQQSPSSTNPASTSK